MNTKRYTLTYLAIWLLFTGVNMYYQITGHVNAVGVFLLTLQLQVLAFMIVYLLDDTGNKTKGNQT